MNGRIGTPTSCHTVEPQTASVHGSCADCQEETNRGFGLPNVGSLPFKAASGHAELAGYAI